MKDQKESNKVDRKKISLLNTTKLLTILVVKKPRLMIEGLKYSKASIIKLTAQTLALRNAMITLFSPPLR